MDITTREIEMLQEDVYNLASIIYDTLTSNPADLNLLDMVTALNNIKYRNKPED